MAVAGVVVNLGWMHSRWKIIRHSAPWSWNRSTLKYAPQAASQFLWKCTSCLSCLQSAGMLVPKGMK
jgi:hypothetical protein